METNFPDQNEIPFIRHMEMATLHYYSATKLNSSGIKNKFLRFHISLLIY